MIEVTKNGSMRPVVLPEVFHPKPRLQTAEVRNIRERSEKGHSPPIPWNVSYPDAYRTPLGFSPKNSGLNPTGGRRRGQRRPVIIGCDLPPKAVAVG